jgi:hypothetical protein
MISQRVSRPILLSWLLTLVALAVPAVSPAHAGTKTDAWRPGWLPGEPTTFTVDAPIWARPVKVTNTGGLYIAIDPVTHRPIAPTPEQLRAFNARHAQDALEAPTRPLRIEKLPNGGEILFLNGAFRSYTIARRAPNGRITVTETAPAREVK